MTKEFILSDEDYAMLMSACKPVPYMIIGGVEPRSPQENANNAWMRLGEKYGFIWDSVRPVSGKSDRCITAELRALEDEK